MSGYGVLVGQIAQGREDPADDPTPHYELLVEAGGPWRAAINTRSDTGSALLVFLDDAFAAPTRLDLPRLAAGAPGWTALATGPDGAGLDYLRDDLFPLGSMTAAPATGGDASISARLDAVVARAAADANAVAIVAGNGFADRDADPVFGFSPARGVHDVHMMQGNSGRFAGENRVRGDGAFFVRFGDGSTFAFFARFASQATGTDGTTGAPAG